MIYITKYNQSIYDVCLQTYGTLDYLLKLVTDNNINNLNTQILTKTSFIFDERLVIDRLLKDNNNRQNVTYNTATQVFGVKLTEESGIKITEDGVIKIIDL